MRLLKQNDFQEIIRGANLLGTGGGGTIEDAKPFLSKIQNPVRLLSMDKLKSNQVICTVFGIGGKQTVDPIRATTDALALFTKTGFSISAIVPVEVGAESIATAIFAASRMNIPIVDSDIVGYRSSPEIFLETISLGNISRTPCVVADDKGNTALIMNTESVHKLESILRNFAISVGGDAFVAGYPMRIKDISKILPEDSISFSQKVGRIIYEIQKKQKTLSQLYKETHLEYFDSGIISRTIFKKTKGFESGEYIINSKIKTDTWKILFKNENLVLLKNEKVTLTCPDSIILLDINTYQGVNNFESNNKKHVAILGRKAIPIWRTKKGKQLFHPKSLGFNYKQILLM